MTNTETNNLTEIDLYAQNIFGPRWEYAAILEDWLADYIVTDLEETLDTDADFTLNRLAPMAESFLKDIAFQMNIALETYCSEFSEIETAHQTRDHQEQHIVRVQVHADLADTIEPLLANTPNAIETVDHQLHNHFFSNGYIYEHLAGAHTVTVNGNRYRIASTLDIKEAIEDAE